jgi:hypothetical protein
MGSIGHREVLVKVEGTVLKGAGNEAIANSADWGQPPSAVRRPRRIGPLPAVAEVGLANLYDHPH